MRVTLRAHSYHRPDPSLRSGRPRGALPATTAHAAAAPPREAPRVWMRPSRRPCLVNGVPERLGQLVHLLGRQEQPRRADQLLVAEHVVPDALAHDLLLEQPDAVDE